MSAAVGASFYPSAEELVEAARASIPGPDVFAVAPDTVLSYCCGTWKLVEHDIAAVLPAELARTVLDFLRSLGVCEAFRIREELVNYKKVLLHVHQRGLDVERRLSQLASFFHEERERCEGGFSRPSARCGEITDARMECKGRCEATYDARLVGKTLCNLPRHPAKGRPSALQELPRSLRCWRIAEAALAACPSEEAAVEPAKPSPCDSVVDTDGVHGCSWHQAAEQSLASQGWPEHLCGFVRAVMICRGADKALRVRDELLLARKELEACAERASAALGRLGEQPSAEQVAELLAATAQGHRAPLARCTELADVAAQPAAAAQIDVGAVAKPATATPDWTPNWVVAPEEGMAPDASVASDAAAVVKAEVLLAVAVAPAGEGEEDRKRAMATAMNRQRHRNLLTGCLPPLREAAHWLRVIEETGASGAPRLFLAGDGRGVPAVRYGARPDAPPAFCVPQGFQGGSGPEDHRLCSVIAKYTPHMRSSLASEGWPEHICDRLGSAGTDARRPGSTDKAQPAAACAGGRSESSRQGRPACSACGRRFSALWVHRGVCCECETAARAAGRCPFSQGCKSSWFCPHAQCCFKCEAHSCDECRLSRGDGEHVSQLAAQLRPARVALDFDRTLATTRSGGTPLVGKDSLDADLLPVLWEHQAACMIVTRNSHVDEINAFLAANGAPEKLPVHSLKRPRSKAEFIIPGLGDDEIAIFVDDTIAELVDPLVANDQRVHRVLFVRGLL